MWIWWKEKRIDFYIAAVIIPSIILAVLALWALVNQYNFINYQLQTESGATLPASELFGSFSRVSIFAIAMVIFALLLILILGSYLSAHDVQRKLEVAKLKNDFVSTVSHELKTPLTSIRLLAERLLKLGPGEIAKQREYHSLIFTQSYRLSHLIGNILDFSKLEQEGKQGYKFEKANLTKLIKQAIDGYPTKLIRSDCKLEINLADDVPLFYLDKEAISRAFINLLDNALKFSPSEAAVKVACGKVNKEAFVEVADQGPGIEEKEKKKIFQRFYHTGRGTGLGLALVQRIVQGHKGRIELESEKGKGSKFRIVLPLKQKA
jgi:signal transduction histidine kinase